MRVTGINISNVLGVSSAEIVFNKPVMLVGGKNGAGKSSIAESIRQALTGEPGRGVENKKDYAELLHDGANVGMAMVEWNGGTATVVLPKGDRKVEGAGDSFDCMPFVIDPASFASLDDKARRAFLFGLMGVRVTPGAVREKLIARGIDMKKADEALPLLAAGFDTAQTEAKAKARDAKASWKTVTGGETWGKDKAAKWQPAPLEMDAEKARTLCENAETKATRTYEEVKAIQQMIGHAKAQAAARRKHAEERESLTEKAGMVKRHAEKLERDTAEMHEWENKVAAAKAAAGVPAEVTPTTDSSLLRGLASVTRDFIALTCSHPDVEWDSGLLNRAAVHVSEYEKRHGAIPETAKPGAGDPEAAANLPKYEQALSLMRSSVENGKRHLEEAKHAAERLAQLDREDAETPIDLEALESKAAELEETRKAWRTDADKYRRIAEAAEARQSVIEKAAGHHADVIAWDAIAASFAPDGIPAEFLTDAMRPFNETLAELSEIAQWPTVSIDDGMRILMGGRPYHFRSESEKWRADAIIAAAIAKQSRLRFLMLDRFDVLDLQGRGDALCWLSDMIADGVIESALVLGTLKSLPSGLPENIGAVWIDGGRIEATA